MSGLRALQFVALVLTALALAPAGAHLFALPNKIQLPADQYFVTQGIYRGWAVLGVLLFAALAATLALAYAVRATGAPFWFAIAAFVAIVLNLAIFFAWTYPANVATDNWTHIPANWEQLRAQWEYSHAANAVILFVAFCSVVLSTLLAERA